MATGRGLDAAPGRVAVYRRTLPVSLARVWENVYDWEHLPWLHSESFEAIELEDSGSWGWRARVGLPPRGSDRWIRIELCVDRPAHRYVTRTLAGAGAGTEIWTALRERGPMETAIEVGFHLPRKQGQDRERSGRSLIAVYTHLWDQDEAMMVERERRASARSEAIAAELGLGCVEALRAELPKRVQWGGSPVWIYELHGLLRVDSLVCPHWSGPLAADPCDEAVLVCPWHGYRFDLGTGKSCDGHALRLRPAPELVIEADEVFLRSPGP